MPQQQSAKMTTKVYKKHINIRAKYRLPTLLIILLVIAMPISLLFLIVGLRETSPLVLLGAIPILITITAFGFLFNYGIRITPTKMRILSEDTFKVYYFEEISRVEIFFTDTSLCVDVKTKKQKHDVFVFGDFSLDRSSVFSRFLTVKFKMSRENADRITEKLLDIPKIKIQNSYKEN